MPKEFAEWLKGELAERGLSQRELALRSGVASTTLSYIVRGEHQPTVESIVMLDAISHGACLCLGASCRAGDSLRAHYNT